MTSDLQCLRCKYRWKRRTWNRLPRQCPNCHRNDWNKPEVGKVGRPPLKVKEESMSASAKPVENEPIESVVWFQTHPDKCECGLCSPDHRNVLIGPIGPIKPNPTEPNAATPEPKHKFVHLTELAQYQGNELDSLQKDASTDDLLNHLLEQIEKDGVE